ncbi:MAG: nucleoside deaminase [Acidobacteria bacterium]|nr:nucleoside deaminase [Acidobacteriota bacterium]
MNEAHMKRAVALSRKGMELGHGGPFGAVIVRDGEIVGEGWNEVLISNDSTAHAEVVAIRNACRELGTYDLSGCEIYTSCEPCPMCLGAIYWSRISKVYFSIGRHDAAGIEFRDEFIYDELKKPLTERALPMEYVPCDGAMDVFAAWMHSAGRTTY